MHCYTEFIRVWPDQFLLRLLWSGFWCRVLFIMFEKIQRFWILQGCLVKYFCSAARPSMYSHCMEYPWMDQLWSFAVSPHVSFYQLSTPSHKYNQRCRQTNMHPKQNSILIYSNLRDRSQGRILPIFAKITRAYRVFLQKLRDILYQLVSTLTLDKEQCPPQGVFFITSLYFWRQEFFMFQMSACIYVQEEPAVSCRWTSWSSRLQENYRITIFVNWGLFRHFETITNIRT